MTSVESTSPPEKTFVTTPLPGDRRQDRQQLPARTTTYWRLRAAVIGLVMIGLLTWGAIGLDWFDPAIRWAVVTLGVAWFGLVGVIVRPPIRRRLFWYSLSDNEIDVQHGWLVQKRTVVPMSRVQHLKSEQGPLERRFRLADVHIHTAAGVVVVHGLDDGEAAQVRARISLLAHLSDDV